MERVSRKILSWDNGAGKHCGAGAEQGFVSA